MKPIRPRVSVLLAVMLCWLAAELAKPQTKAPVTASGVFMGRSGKPMAKAKLMLGEVVGDQEITYAKIKLGAKPINAVTDDNGRFQFTGVIPGRYTVVYQPAGSTAPAPAPAPEISIRALSSHIKSFLPMMRDVEVGRGGAPYPDRVWSREFTLLKGHTLFCQALGEPTMRVWNATARRGQQGPYVEFRRGVIWMERFDEKTPVKLEAWGY